MSHNPTSNFRMTEVKGCEAWIEDSATDTHPEAASSTKPTIFCFSDQCAALHVTSSAIDNIAETDPVPAEAFRVLRRDPGNFGGYYPVIANVLGHYRRDSRYHIVRRM
jgi:hypothetical protein